MAQHESGEIWDAAAPRLWLIAYASAIHGLSADARATQANGPTWVTNAAADIADQALETAKIRAPRRVPGPG